MATSKKSSTGDGKKQSRAPVKQQGPASLPPPFARLLIADDFRIEQSGKVLGIGLFPDYVVVLQVNPRDPEPTPEVPFGIPSLSFLVTVGGFIGTQKVMVQIGDSKSHQHDVKIDEAGHSANLIITAQPMILKSFGKKKVIVEFCGHREEFEFEFRRINVASVPRSVLQPAPQFAPDKQKK